MTLAPCQMPVPAFDRPLLLPCGLDDEDDEHDEDGDDEDNQLYQQLRCGGDGDELRYENIDREEGRNKNEDEDELA